MEVIPINPKRIYRSIIEQIIGLVRKGNLQEGQKLPSERELAGMFNVSRASLREALRALEIIGIVEVRTGEGTYVTPFNVAQFINTIAPLFVRDDSMEEDLLEFRKLLETEAVNLAVVNAADDDLARLSVRIENMKNALDGNDTVSGIREDVNFHKELFRLSGNRILQGAMECTANLLERSVLYNRERILSDRRNSPVLVDQHAAICRALTERNSEEAKRLIVLHLDFVKTISKRLEKETP